MSTQKTTLQEALTQHTMSNVNKDPNMTFHWKSWFGSSSGDPYISWFIPKTNIAPQNRPSQKETHPFSGAFAVGLRECNPYIQTGVLNRMSSPTTNSIRDFPGSTGPGHLKTPIHRHSVPSRPFGRHGRSMLCRREEAAFWRQPSKWSFGKSSLNKNTPGPCKLEMAHQFIWGTFIED